MKNFIFGGLCLFVLVALGAAFTKVTRLMAPTTIDAINADVQTKDLAAYGLETGNNFYQKSFTGAIANAEKDTLALPNFLSNYQLSIATTRASVSGTHNVKMYLDESSFLTGTANWRVIDSTSTTTATLATIRQGTTYGVRHRIRMSGTGSQSSTYAISVIGKKLN